MNVTDLRGVARTGLCLPRECTQAHLDNFTDTLLGFINPMILKLPEFGIVINNTIFGPESQVTMKFTTSDAYVEEWQAWTSTGFLFVVGFLAVIIGVSVLANLSLYVEHRMGSKKGKEELFPFKQSVMAELPGDRADSQADRLLPSDGTSLASKETILLGPRSSEDCSIKGLKDNGK